MANVIRGDHVLLLTVGLQVLGILIPYAIVLHRNIFSPPLPFISQTIAFSPENGIFSLLMSLGSFFGIFISIIIHKLSETTELKLLKFTKNASTSFSILYFLSWILIVASPITFTDVPNKYEWVTSVLWIHMIGALLMLASCTFFVISQAACSWNTNKLNDNHSFSRRAFYVILPISCIGIASLLALGIEELSSEGQSMEDTYYALPTQLSFRYIVTSICEWTLITCMWLTLMTFYDDMRCIKLKILVKSTI